ncbi:MAG: DUF937 domain-containing protein [Anaerolineae bacterium]|nr:DUF937 domain-containing protein [Anaerolineae bacterium]
MDVLTQQLMQQLSGEGMAQISQRIGADERTTGSALGTVLPLLVGALANNASNPSGAQSLHQALAEDHDGSILNNMSGFLANPEAANGMGILGHILGAQQPAVTQGVAQQTGLNSGQVGQLLQIAAPLLMGALGQQQHQGGLNTNSLMSFLGGQQQEVQTSNPGIMGLLTSALDTNKDGSIVGEVLGLLGRLLGGKKPR